MIQKLAANEIKAKASGVGDRPEIELLLCCARTSIDTATTERIKTLLQENIDWTYLIETASKHGTKPLLYQSLNSTYPEAVPQTILNQLRKDFRTNAVRNLHLTKELLNILDLFAAHEIPVFAFKGPALAVSAYGDLSLRQFSDLDILVRERDLLRARDLFISQGDEMKIERVELTEAQRATFLRSPKIHKLVRECAYPFVRHQSRVMVELHWTMMPKYLSFAIDSEQVWERLEPVTILGKSVLTLSPEDSLLLLCGHGVKDCWDKLSRICDIAELIRNHPELDWTVAIERAAQLGNERILLIGLFLAKELLGTSLPESVWQRIQADSTVRELASQVREGLFPQPDAAPKAFKVTRFHLKLKERLFDKVRYFLLVATTPTTTDWQVLPLATFPPLLYYLLRPMRLVGEYGLSVLQRLRGQG